MSSETFRNTMSRFFSEPQTEQKPNKVPALGSSGWRAGIDPTTIPSTDMMEQMHKAGLL